MNVSIVKIRDTLSSRICSYSVQSSSALLPQISLSVGSQERCLSCPLGHLVAGYTVLDP